MIEAIYIIIGLLAILAISVFTLCQCFQWALEILDRYREPYWRANISRQYSELATAFYKDKKIIYIFDSLKDSMVSGRGVDVWKFRDEVEDKFKEDSK